MKNRVAVFLFLAPLGLIALTQAVPATNQGIPVNEQTQTQTQTQANYQNVNTIAGPNRQTNFIENTERIVQLIVKVLRDFNLIEPQTNDQGGSGGPGLWDGQQQQQWQQQLWEQLQWQQQQQQQQQQWQQQQQQQQGGEVVEVVDIIDIGPSPAYYEVQNKVRPVFYVPAAKPPMARPPAPTSTSSPSAVPLPPAKVRPPSSTPSPSAVRFPAAPQTPA